MKWPSSSAGELPGCDLLSDGRRRRADRDVEGVRRDGGAGLDRAEAPEDDRGAGGGLRSRLCGPSSRREKRSDFWEDATTVASGLRVPKPLGDFLMLEAVRESGGTAIAVSDAELIDAGIRLG